MFRACSYPLAIFIEYCQKAISKPETPDGVLFAISQLVPICEPPPLANHWIAAALAVPAAQLMPGMIEVFHVIGPVVVSASMGHIRSEELKALFVRCCVYLLLRCL